MSLVQVLNLSLLRLNITEQKLHISLCFIRNNDRSVDPSVLSMSMSRDRRGNESKTHSLLPLERKLSGKRPLAHFAKGFRAVFHPSIFCFCVFFSVICESFSILMYLKAKFDYSIITGCETRPSMIFVSYGCLFE